MAAATAGPDVIAVVQAARVTMNRLIVAGNVMPRCVCCGPTPVTAGAGASSPGPSPRRRVLVPVCVVAP